MNDVLGGLLGLEAHGDGDGLSAKYLKFISTGLASDRLMEIRYLTPRGLAKLHRASKLFSSQQDFLECCDLLAPSPFGTHYSLNLGVPSSKSGSLRDVDIVEVRALAVDFDFKVFDGDATAAESHLKRVLPPELWPTCRSFSGGGFHLIWWLRQPEPKSKEIRKIMRALSKALHPSGGCFDDISNPSRVIRLPLSTNTKPGLGSPLCIVLEFNPNRVFTLDSFAWWLDEFSLSAPDKGQQNSTKAGVAVPATAQGSKIIEAIEAFAPRAHQLNTCSIARGLAHYRLPQAVTEAVVAKLASLDNASDPAALRRAVSDMYAQEATTTDTTESPSGAKGDTKPPKSIQLLNLLESEKLVLFRDQFQEAHVVLPDAPRQIMKVRSKAFRRYVARLAWIRLGFAASSDMLQTVLHILEGKASFEGDQIDLHVRVACHEDAVYYDLGSGKAVKTTADSWLVTTEYPVLFRTANHQKPQVEPVAGGDLRDLLGFVNMPSRSENRGADLLLLVWVVTGFIPGFPHPPLVVHGPQGSAKSSLFKLLKELMDPSVIQTLSPLENRRELILQLAHHWFLPLDNLSILPDWMSDALSRACTGDGHSQRELYTDADEVIFAFHRVIGLNGINLVVDKPDLLDRSLLLPLERIPEERRLGEAELWKRFNDAKPRLLGAIFDAVAATLRIIPSVQLTRLPRMADFTRWGVAVSQALGYSSEEFLSAYRGAIAAQHEEALAASPVAQAVMSLMAERESWSGTPSELHAELRSEAERLHIDIHSREWPRTGNWVYRRLVAAQTNLEAVGIQIERGEGAKRFITLRKHTESGVDVAVPASSSAPPQHPQQNLWKDGAAGGPILEIRE
jgi:hypothetical protein